MGLLDRLRSRRAPAQTVILHIGTRVGTDDGFRAVVDDAASVHLLDRPVRVGWWIGGDDRWYDPAAERAVRQRREVGRVARRVNTRDCSAALLNSQSTQSESSNSGSMA